MAATNHTLDFAASQELRAFHLAYEGLEVLAGLSDTDSHHVANVLAILNQAFQDHIDRLSPKLVGLHLVDR